MLLTNIAVSCERGVIRVTWEWQDSAADSVSIFYKKDAAEGDGVPFAAEEVMRMKYSIRAEAARKLGNEWGLYTFTLVPKTENGFEGEKVRIEHVMIGKPLRVPWEFIRQEKEALARFPKLAGVVPAGTACLEMDACRYQLDYALTKDTTLLFPCQLDTEKIKVYEKKPSDKERDCEEVMIYAKEPLDQAYCFYKDN